MTNKGSEAGLEARVKNTTLVKAREALMMTQEKAAEKIGISKLSLFNYENTKSYPSHTVQKKICTFYSQNGYALNEKDTFPEYMEVIAIKRAGKGNSMHPELIFPLISVNESYQINNDKMDAKCVLDELLKDVSERSRGILTARFGLNGDGPKTLMEVAKEYNITRERVRQIEHYAIKELGGKAEFYRKKGMI